MNDTISPLASVSPSAVIGEGVMIAPFAVVESGVTLGPGCRLEPGAVVKSGSTLGARVWVHTAAVVGGPPQDYSYDPSRRVGVRIGDDTILREGITVNLATKDGGETVVGKNCMLMAQSHVAHDCTVGDHVVLANTVMLAGHATIGDRVFISGATGVHQFCRVGESAMIGGGTAVTADVPPYCMVVGRNALVGLNLVGLRRRGFSRAVMAEIKEAFRSVYSVESLNLRDNAAAALASGTFATEEARRFLSFFGEGRRPTFARPRRDQDGEEGTLRD